MNVIIDSQFFHFLFHFYSSASSLTKSATPSDSTTSSHVLIAMTTSQSTGTTSRPASESNFDKYDTSAIDTQSLPYDFSSIMHDMQYGKLSFC